MAEQQVRENAPTPETVDPEIVFPDIFRIVTVVETMLDHFYHYVAEGNEQHNWADATLFQVKELNRRLEAFYEALVHAEIKPKASKEAGNG